MLSMLAVGIWAVPFLPQDMQPPAQSALLVLAVWRTFSR